MAIDERRRHEMYLSLERALGHEAADALMAHLPPAGWAEVATKSDLDALRIATKTDIDNLRAATKTDIDNLRAATKTDIDNLRAATKADLDAHRAATKSEIDTLRQVNERDHESLKNAILADMHRSLRVQAIAMVTVFGVMNGVMLAALNLS